MTRSFLRALLLAALVAVSLIAGQGAAVAGIGWERDPDQGDPVGIAWE